jgi:hypothetical protein
MANGTTVTLPATGFSMAGLIAIEEAIASGADTVSYDGKSVRYRSVDEMLRVRGIMRKALGIDTGKSETFLVSHDRGFGGGRGVTGV